MLLFLIRVIAIAFILYCVFLAASCRCFVSEFFISISQPVPNISLIYIFRYGTLVICFLVSSTSENASPRLLHMNYLWQVCSSGVTMILAAMLHCLLESTSSKGKFDCQQENFLPWERNLDISKFRSLPLTLPFRKFYIFSHTHFMLRHWILLYLTSYICSS